MLLFVTAALLTVELLFRGGKQGMWDEILHSAQMILKIFIKCYVTASAT